MTVRKIASNSIAQTIEAKLAKQLAGNEKVTRDRGFKKLKDHVFSKCTEGEEAFSRSVMRSYLCCENKVLCRSVVLKFYLQVDPFCLLEIMDPINF